MPRGKRMIGSDDPVLCKLCQKHITRALNLRKHLLAKHKDFVRERMKEESLTFSESVNVTFRDHVVLNSELPKTLLSKFEGKNYSKPLMNSIKSVVCQICHQNIPKVEVLSVHLLKDHKDFIEGRKEEEKLASLAESLDKTYRNHVPGNSDIPKSLLEKFKSSRKQRVDNYRPENNNDRNESLNEIENSHDYNAPRLNAIKLSIRDPYQKKFFSTKIKDEVRFFCFVCHRYSTKPSSGNGADWHINGVIFSSQYRMGDAMKKHLASKQHRESEVDSKLEKKKAPIFNPVLASKCTENLCIAGQFLASHNFSQRFYVDLCQFLDLTNISRIINENGADFHPLGNQHQSKMSIRSAQIACYEATKEWMAAKDLEVSPVTKLQSRYMLSFDKSTAYKNGQRLAVVMTKLNESGLLEDKLISTSVLKDFSSKGTCNHITEEAAGIITTKNVAVVCSGNDAVFARNVSSVVTKMKMDENYSEQIISLEDVCHNLEQFLFPSNPDPSEIWVSDTILKCNSIFNSILSNSNILNYLKLYELKSSEDVKYHGYQTQGKTTRFTEYGHVLFTTFLKNLEILYKALPNMADDSSDFDSLTKASVKGIMNLIADPIFVARVLLLDTIFLKVSKIEKDAQSQQFGPFDFVNVLENFEVLLAATKGQNFSNIKEVLDEKIFCHSIRQSSKVHKVRIDLTSLNVHSQVIETQYSGVECQQQFIEYIDILLSRIAKLLRIPDIITIGVEIFSIPAPNLIDEDLDDRIEKFRFFLNEINTEFQECFRPGCLLLSCLCIDIEWKFFFSYVDEIRYLYTKDKGVVNHTMLFAHLLSHKFAEEKRNNIINILRALEIMQLMKASQSGAEKVVSEVTKLIEGRFENKPETDSGVDMVNVRLFLKLNSNIFDMDAPLARQKFLAKGHREALKKSKPMTHKSLTLKRKYKNNDSANLLRKSATEGMEEHNDSNDVPILEDIQDQEEDAENCRSWEQAFVNISVKEELEDIEEGNTQTAAEFRKARKSRAAILRAKAVNQKRKRVEENPSFLTYSDVRVKEELVDEECVVVGQENLVVITEEHLAEGCVLPETL